MRISSEDFRTPPAIDFLVVSTSEMIDIVKYH